MDKKTKRTLIIAGAVEAVIIIFCTIVSLTVLLTYNAPESGPNWKQMNIQKNGAFIGWLQNNPTPFFILIVLPLLVILVLDIVYLIIYASKKESKLSDAEREAIAEKAKREAALELEGELAEEETEEEVEEAPKEEEKPAVSIADELRKLKELKDEGILSEEEFAAEKAKLLNK